MCFDDTDLHIAWFDAHHARGHLCVIKLLMQYKLHYLEKKNVLARVIWRVCIHNLDMSPCVVCVVLCVDAFDN